MAIFIEVISGPRQGTLFKVEDGLILGRTHGDILVDDPKISGRHAQITTDPTGAFILNDLNSANGLLVSGERVKSITLSGGVSFQAGGTQFRVSIQEPQSSETSTAIGESAHAAVSWRTTLANKLLVQMGELRAKQNNLERLNPTIKLVFLRGIQADKELVLGYGKRVAGAGSLDIELLDSMAPINAFEFIPSAGGVQLKVLAAGKVLLNNRSVTLESLNDGDVISVGKTQIRVNFL